MERILEANPVLDNMGGIIMWPGWQVGGPTMNQARGFGAKAKATIGDPLDLTLECIRRAYIGDSDDAVNPLGSTLTRYWEFFALFGDFDGYIKFWLLAVRASITGSRRLLTITRRACQLPLAPSRVQ